MSNVSDLKPWFREDIAKALISIYFTSKMANSYAIENEDFQKGFASAISSVAIMVGINPMQVLSVDDVKSFASKQSE